MLQLKLPKKPVYQDKNTSRNNTNNFKSDGLYCKITKTSYLCPRNYLFFSKTKTFKVHNQTTSEITDNIDILFLNCILAVVKNLLFAACEYAFSNKVLTTQNIFGIEMLTSNGVESYANSLKEHLSEYCKVNNFYLYMYFCTDTLNDVSKDLLAYSQKCISN